MTASCSIERLAVLVEGLTISIPPEEAGLLFGAVAQMLRSASAFGSNVLRPFTAVVTLTWPSTLMDTQFLPVTILDGRPAS